ncbi:hypothetical protein BDW02DRAFT_607573 [Decorospora gaudefroyi]|uniref:Ubiquitin-like protease family profile domain-containing protein n=1 Tax=Decorospora gaudefroyi TaxID=184978 RepID=A0A6A5K8L3_9PLEO|nr:hypothetical protein BDW02DRAFT_607573 [Decorospora gaudefroyi]
MDGEWWQNVYDSREEMLEHIPETAVWVPCAQTTTTSEASFTYNVLNAWALAMGLEPDAAFVPAEEAFFVRAERVFQSAFEDGMSWKVLLAFFQCTGFVKPPGGSDCESGSEAIANLVERQTMADSEARGNKIVMVLVRLRLQDGIPHVETFASDAVTEAERNGVARLVREGQWNVQDTAGQLQERLAQRPNTNSAPPATTTTGTHTAGGEEPPKIPVLKDISGIETDFDPCEYLRAELKKLTDSGQLTAVTNNAATFPPLTETDVETRIAAVLRAINELLPAGHGFTLILNLDDLPILSPQQTDHEHSAYFATPSAWAILVTVMGSRSRLIWSFLRCVGYTTSAEPPAHKRRFRSARNNKDQYLNALNARAPAGPGQTPHEIVYRHFPADAGLPHTAAFQWDEYEGETRRTEIPEQIQSGRFTRILSRRKKGKGTEGSGTDHAEPTDKSSCARFRRKLEEHTNNERVVFDLVDFRKKEKPKPKTEIDDELDEGEVSLAIASVTLAINQFQNDMDRKKLQEDVDSNKPHNHVDRGFGFVNQVSVQSCASEIPMDILATLRPGRPLMVPFLDRYHIVLLAIDLDEHGEPTFSILDSKSYHFSAESRATVHRAAVNLFRGSHWWKGVFEESELDKHCPKYTSWIPVSQQGRHTECGFYTILNAWALALGLRPDPNVNIDWTDQFFTDMLDVIHLARIGRADWELISLFLECRGFVLKAFPDHKWWKPLEASEVNLAIAAVVEAIDRLQSENHQAKNPGTIFTGGFSLATSTDIVLPEEDAPPASRPRRCWLMPLSILRGGLLEQVDEWRATEAENRRQQGLRPRVQQPRRNGDGHTLLAVVQETEQNEDRPIVPVFEISFYGSCPKVFKDANRPVVNIVRQVMDGKGWSRHRNAKLRVTQRGHETRPSARQAEGCCESPKAVVEGWQCGHHTVINAWILALGLLPNPKAEYDREVYKHFHHLARAAVGGILDW